MDKELTPEQKAKYLEGLNLVDDKKKKFQHAWNAQITKQWSDFEIDQFLRNNHFIEYSYNAATNTLVATLPSTFVDNLKTKIPVNKILAAHKSLKGFITRGDRAIVVMPIDTNGADEAQQQSVNLSSFAYFLYKKLRLKKVEKEMADFGLRRSFGVVKVYWDPDAENGQGFCAVAPIDTFDFYWDPNANTLQSCGYIDHVSKKSIQDVKNNQNYDKEAREMVTGDGKVSPSYVRSQELQLAYPDIANAPSNDSQTTLIHETWEKVKNGKKTEVWVTTWCEGVDLPLRHEKTEFNQYPFVIYNTDKHPHELIGEAPLKPLVVLNRVIDRIESQVADYNNVFAKGTYMMEKGAGLKIINNKSAKVFQINQGFKFDQLDIKPLPATIFEQEDRMNKYMDDISGIQEAMVGQKPEGTRSGVELEQLQEAAANNINEYRENMDIFLEELYMQLFELYSRHVSTPRLHPVGSNHNNQVIKQFVGKKYSSKSSFGTISVPDFIHITIAPDSLLGYTPTERFNRVMQLLQQQVFDPEAALETIGIQGYQFIVKRLEDRRNQQMQEENQQKAQQAMAEAQARSIPVAPKVNINVKAMADPDQTSEILETQGISSIPGMPSEISDALKEHELMYRGQQLPGTKNATPEHTAEHIREMKSPRFMTAGPEVDQAFMHHILDEESARNPMMSLGGLQTPQAPTPIPEQASQSIKNSK